MAMRRSISAMAGATSGRRLEAIFTLVVAGAFVLRVARDFLAAARLLRVVAGFFPAAGTLRVFDAFLVATRDFRVFDAFLAAAVLEADFDAAMFGSPFGPKSLPSLAVLNKASGRWPNGRFAIS